MTTKTHTPPSPAISLAESQQFGAVRLTESANAEISSSDARAPAPCIALLDPDPHSRAAIAQLCQAESIHCDEYADAEAFFAAPAAQSTNLILLARQYSGADDIATLHRLQQLPYCPPVIMLTEHSTIAQALSALRIGAYHVIEKPYQAADLLHEIHRALNQDGSARQQWQNKQRVQQRLAQLTPREYEVMCLMLQGRLNKQIADDLSISMKTVEVHRSRTLEKMQINNAIELLIILHEAGVTL